MAPPSILLKDESIVDDDITNFNFDNYASI